MSNKKETSPKVATIAAKALSNPRSSQLTKILAASLLSQSSGKRK